ncbi:MAG: hypothetical protein LBS24_03800, partial [Clostridiales Family XIII bacterium]|nr:hypothetical protein [Clostridiales Family XIII bacterium]
MGFIRRMKGSRRLLAATLALALVVPAGFGFGVMKAGAASGDLTADFGGVALTESGADFELTFAEARDELRNLNINTTFSAISTKRVEITVANGLGIESATGMVGNAAKDEWTFSPASLAGSQFEGIVTGATWERDAESESVNGYRPRSGKLVYELSDTTTNFAPVIGINGDRPFLACKDAVVFPIADIGSDRAEAIKVESYEDGSLSAGVSLKNYTVKNNNAASFFVSGGESNFRFIEPGADYKLPIYQELRYKESTAGRYLQGGIEYQFSLPKAAGLQGVAADGPFLIAGQANSLTAADISYVLDTSHPDKDTITVKISENADTRNVHFYLTGTLDTGLTAGEELRAALETQKVTFLDGSVAGNMPRTYRLPVIQIAEQGDTFNFVTHSTSGWHTNINAKETDSPAAMVDLGGFAIGNNNATAIDGKRLRLDFDTDAVGVQAVRLLTGASGAADVVAKTTHGRTIHIASVPKTQSGSEKPVALSHYATLNLYNELDSGEYIASVEYGMGEIPAGAAVDTSATGQNMICYGRLLATPPSYGISATVLHATVPDPAYDNSAHWAEHQATHTQTIKVIFNEDYSISYNNVGIASKSGAYWAAGTGAPLTGGSQTPRELRATYSLLNYPYNQNILDARKGFVVYVREPAGLVIDPDSVYATYGLDGARRNPVSPFTDNTGATVYKIQLDGDDDIFGHYNEALSDYPAVYLYANVTAKSTAPATVFADEIFFGGVIGGEKDLITGYSGPAKTFDTLGFTDDPTNQFVVPGRSAFLTVSLTQTLNVSVSADRGDGNWKYYSGIPSTIIDLNTERTARYRLDVRNDSGKEIPGGFTALIPIPKAGKTTGDPTIQSADFTWPLYVKEDIEAYLQTLGKTGYTVHYATSYLLDKDAGDWQDWSAVASDRENIRMVKITYTQDLPDGFADSLWFPLATCKDHSDDDEVTPYHGEVNIYSALIHANVLGNAAYRPSDPVALRLNTGVVEGYVWLDEDRDALAPGGGASPADGTDTPVRNAIVRVYKAGHANDSASLLDSSATDAQGYYQFLALDRETNVDVVILNPGTAPAPLRFVAPDVSEAASLTISDKQPKPKGEEYINALVQKPYTVDFDTDGGTPVPSDQFVYVNGYAARPA